MRGGRCRGSWGGCVKRLVEFPAGEKERVTGLLPRRMDDRAVASRISRAIMRPSRKSGLLGMLLLGREGDEVGLGRRRLEWDGARGVGAWAATSASDDNASPERWRNFIGRGGVDLGGAVRQGKGRSALRSTRATTTP
jgi:hypothetical protein